MAELVALGGESCSMCPSGPANGQTFTAKEIQGDERPGPDSSKLKKAREELAGRQSWKCTERKRVPSRVGAMPVMSQVFGGLGHARVLVLGQQSGGIPATVSAPMQGTAARLVCAP